MNPPGCHRARTPLLRTLVASLAAAAAAAATLAGPLGAPASAAKWTGDCSTAPAAAAGTIRVTQANLLSGQEYRRFQADVASVLAGRPDLVTYNEVAHRYDANLAPEGYDLWRTAKDADLSAFPGSRPGDGQYLAATPVAWRSDRWQAIGQGTTNITNVRGKSSREAVELGVRYANWVTLRSLVDGRVLSLVSVHFATEDKGLLEESIHGLGRLTNQLALNGPVLVGGDLNVGYDSALFRSVGRPLLARYGLTSTYDVVGGPMGGTGDKFGATIDYLLMRDASSFGVQYHCKRELNSDHDAVTADLVPNWQPGSQPTAFASGTMVNNPHGTVTARRAVLDLMIRAIDGAPSGAGIHLDTHVLSDKLVLRSLLRARNRGVYVQFLTRRYQPTNREAFLMRKLGSRVRTRQWAVECPEACRRIDRRTRLAPTRLLVSSSGLSRAVTIVADRPLSRAAVAGPTRATVIVDKGRYDRSFDRFLRLVGRRLR